MGGGRLRAGVVPARRPTFRGQKRASLLMRSSIPATMNQVVLVERTLVGAAQHSRYIIRFVGSDCQRGRYSNFRAAVDIIDSVGTCDARGRGSDRADDRKRCRRLSRATRRIVTRAWRPVSTSRGHHGPVRRSRHSREFRAPTCDRWVGCPRTINRDHDVMTVQCKVTIMHAHTRSA